MPFLRPRDAAFLLTLAAVFTLRDRSALADTATWNSPTTAGWNTVARWSPAVVPNNGTPAGTHYDVFINATGSSYRVTVSAPITVDNLTVSGASSNVEVDSTGGVPNLTVLGTLTLDHAALSVATIAPIAGTLIRDTGTITLAGPVANLATPLDLGATVLGRVDLSAGASLSNLTLTSSLGSIAVVPVQNFSHATLNNVTLDTNLNLNLGLQFAGSVTINNATINILSAVIVAANPSTVLTGTGSLQFGGNSGGTITMGAGTITPGITIRSQSSNGIISFSNTILQGVIQAAGGTVAVSGNLSNTGIISVSNQGSFSRSGVFTNAGTLSISNGTFLTNSFAPVGGTVLFNNASTAFDGTLSSDTDFGNIPGLGRVDIATGASLSNMTVSSSFGSIAVLPNPLSTSVAFNNVTLDADLNVQANILATGTITLNNVTVSLESGGTLTANPIMTLAGTGTYNFDAGSSLPSKIISIGAGTIGPGITVRSLSSIGAIKTTSGALLEGVVSAETAGISLTITGSFTNSGTLQATNGGLLVLGSASTTTFSSGVILANGGEVSVPGTFTNSGVISVTNQGTFSQAGAFTNAGTLSISNGTYFTTSFTPPGGTVLLDNVVTVFDGVLSSDTDFGNIPGLGRVDIGAGASLSNMTISSSLGSISLLANPPAFNVAIANSTLATNVDAQAAISVAGSLTLQGSTITVRRGLSSSTTTAIGGTGSILLASANGLSFQTITIGPGVAIRTLSSGALIIGFVNSTYEGVVSAETPGVTLELWPFVTNSGLFQATNGSTFFINFDGARPVPGSFFLNTGTVLATGGGTVSLGNIGAVASSGTLTADGGTVFFANQTSNVTTLSGVIQSIHGGTFTYNGFSLTATAPLFIDSTSSASIANTGTGNTVSLASVTGGGRFTTSAGPVTTGDINASVLTVQDHVLSIRPNSSYSKVGSLTLGHSASGTSASFSAGLQLNNNRLIVQTAGSANKAAAILSLNEAIFAGHGGSTNVWSSTAGITSAAVAANPSLLTIGVFDNAALGNTNFAGGTNNVDQNSLIVSPALIGDANLDGIVNFNDMLVVTGNWNAQGLVNGISTIDFAHGDLNGDGIVNFNDMLVVTGHWNNTTSAFDLAALIDGASPPGLAAGQGFASIPVPEPATIGLLLGAGIALCRRRPRRRARHWRFPPGQSIAGTSPVGQRTN